MKTLSIAALIGSFGWFVIAATATAASLTTETNGVRFDVRSTPDTPVRDRKTTYTVRLLDAAAKPVTDARMTVTARMADGMSAVAPLRPAGEAGLYRGEILFTMEGPWELSIRVVRPTGRLEIPLREQVTKDR